MGGCGGPGNWSPGATSVFDEASPGAAEGGGAGSTLDVGVAIGVGVVVSLSNTLPPTPAAKATMTAPPTRATLVLA
jgi:hypothetical protein